MGKTEFATKQAITSPTPEWAKWVFRIVAIITTVAAFWVAGTTFIVEPIKVEIMLALKGLDMLVLLLSKAFGVVIKDQEQPLGL